MKKQLSMESRFTHLAAYFTLRNNSDNGFLHPRFFKKKKIFFLEILRKKNHPAKVEKCSSFERVTGCREF